jgi:hypothetical protein
MARTYEAGDIHEQGKKADACSQPTYIKEKEKYFVPNTVSQSNSQCVTIDFRILKYLTH